MPEMFVCPGCGKERPLRMKVELHRYARVHDEAPLDITVSCWWCEAERQGPPASRSYTEDEYAKATRLPAPDQ